MSFISRNIVKVLRLGLHTVAPQYDIVKLVQPISTIEEKLLMTAQRNLSFNYEELMRETSSFVMAMSISEISYRYAASCEIPTLYSSVYTCLLKSLYNEINSMTEVEKQNWAAYFDSFQKEDGFFYDEPTNNDAYAETDWWGARHLVPHILMAYVALGKHPKYEMKWVEKYYNTDFLQSWLDQTDWNSAIYDDSDVDNKVMNVGVTLQYQRDYLHNKQAAKAITFIKDYLVSKINPETGFWGNFNVDDAYELPRMIQFSYHLMRLFMYDDYTFSHQDRMIDLILKSQNKYGGWGKNLNSSACEDIDAIDPLIYLSRSTDYRKDDINQALKRSLLFVLANQNEDGGFVFRRDEPLYYGCKQMSSGVNESAMFPTWFRTLCIAYITKALGVKNKYNIIKSPGY